MTFKSLKRLVKDDRNPASIDPYSVKFRDEKPASRKAFKCSDNRIRLFLLACPINSLFRNRFTKNDQIDKNSQATTTSYSNGYYRLNCQSKNHFSLSMQPKSESRETSISITGNQLREQLVKLALKASTRMM